MAVGVDPTGLVLACRGALGESDGRDRHGELELETPSETTVLRGSRGQSGGQRGWSMDSVRQRTPGVTPGVALLAQPRRLEDEMTPVHKISEENR